MSSVRSETTEDSQNVPSYMRGTLSSLRKNRERVSSSCTPRRLACGGKSSSCFDEYRSERGNNSGPMSSRTLTIPITAETDNVPRYMRPTRSSSQKSVSEKYQIKPPRVPSTSEIGSAPTSRREVKRAERRIQTCNVAMPSFVESLRNNVGSDNSEASTAINNMADVNGVKATRQGSARSTAIGQRKAAIRSNKNKPIQKEQKCETQSS